jgi:AraC-like DNA-binding protein
MRNFLAELAKTIERYSPTDGLHQSPVPDVYYIKVSESERPAKNHWRASLGIVAQGRKEIVLGREVYRCESGHYIAAPIHLPVVSRIARASIEKPFLCLLIHLDPLILSEVAAQIAKDFPKAVQNGPQAIFIGSSNDKMLEAAIRLGKLFQTPEDAPVLGPLLIKEILYHLLKSENGPSIHQFVRSGSKMHKVSQAIHTLRSELKRDVDVTALAKTANMSRSAFFKHFKEVTAASPIQYQKRLRLLEAKRLMIDENETAEGAAFKVGYNSASQFSREYSRMFGTSPLRDALRDKMKIKKMETPARQMS